MGTSLSCWVFLILLLLTPVCSQFFSFSNILSPVHQDSDIPLTIKAVDLQGNIVNQTFPNLKLSAQVGNAMNPPNIFEEHFENGVKKWFYYGGSLPDIDTGGAIGTNKTLLLLDGHGDDTLYLKGLGTDFGATFKPTRATYYVKTTDTTLRGPYFCLIEPDAIDPNAVHQAITVFMADKIYTKYTNGTHLILISGPNVSNNLWYKMDITMDWGNHSVSLYVDDMLAVGPFPMYRGNRTNSIQLLNLFNVDNGLLSYVDEIRLVLKEGQLDPFQNVAVGNIIFQAGIWSGLIRATKVTNNSVSLVLSYQGYSGISNQFNVIAACQPGQYSSNYSSPCANCDANFYSDTVGASACIQCPNGKISSGGSIACQSGINIIGAIVGGAIAAVVVVGIGIGIVLFMRRKKVVKRGSETTDYRSYSGSASKVKDFLRKRSNTVTVPNYMLKHYIPYEQLEVLLDHGEPVILGKGAFGIVYKAKYNDQLVAVKEINSDNIDQTQLEVFVKEAELMRTTPEHPNVIKFIGICPTPFCLLTVFMAKGDLWSFLTTGGKANMQQRFKWIYDIAKGMAHLASHAIVHRDLAARNILLNDNLDAVVSDFGLSRLAPDSNVIYSKGDIGPLKWMAIEAVQKRRYSEKSDVWSFGITCSEILSGEEPYGHDTDAVQAVTMVVTEGLRACIPNNTPLPLANLISSCWSVDPNDRLSFQQICEKLSTIQI